MRGGLARALLVDQGLDLTLHLGLECGELRVGRLQLAAGGVGGGLLGGGRGLLLLELGLLRGEELARLLQLVEQ